MALTDVTVTFDLADILGTDFDARRTKIRVYTNVENQTLMDTSTGETRIGDARVTLASDGTGSFTTWAPGADGNPISWQTYIAVDYPRTGARDRVTRTFGPYTITANADLTELEAEQAVPAEYLTVVTAALDAIVTEAETTLDGYVTDAETAKTGAEDARDLAEQYRDEAHDISMIDTSDGVVEALIQDSGSDTSAALSASFVQRAETVIKAYKYGVRAGTGTAQNTSLAAAFAAAHAAGGAATVELPPGVITIDGTFPMSGYSSGIRGAGGGNLSGPGKVGSVLKCINQTGPVLDFTGFLWPADMVGQIVFEGFTIQGDGTVDATKVKRGIYNPPNEYPIGYTFRNITVCKTGGAGIEMSDTYFGTWQNVTVCDPVGVVTNDVPYIKVTRGNGTVFINVGLRSQVYANPDVHPGDVGASGAFILDGGSDLTHVYTGGTLLGCWAENLHIPSGGCVVASGTMNVAHRDWSFFDCFKVFGGTSTAYIRLVALPPSGGGLGRQGGNTVTGKIEGRTAYYASNYYVDHGVRDSQGGNNIDGTKGWGGYNVLLDSGIDDTSVMLRGGERLGSEIGWVDNSGTSTNTLVDTARGAWVHGRSPSVTQYTTAQTNTAYTIPTGARSLTVRVQGGGGGGGAGRRGAAGTARVGGAGGSGGAYTEWDVAVAPLTTAGITTLYVTVGAGGTAGAAATVNDTNGGAGGAGGDSKVKTSTSADSGANVVAMTAGGPAGGGGGSGAGGAGGGASGGRVRGTTGATANASGSAGGVSSGIGPPGGGSGGGISNADATSAGGGGYPAEGRYATPSTGGTAGGGAGTAGYIPTGVVGYGGAGAGGGSSSASAGGAGGVGGTGAGGGGGGASLNGFNSGAGGAGGVGFVEIIANFN